MSGVVSTFQVTIWMAGNIATAHQVVRDFCYQTGACFTVTPSKFIYTGGEEDGFAIGLVNYPRFPAEYRAAIGKGPIAPWWRSRICTTYMKTRLARRYVESLGWAAHDEFVGLRADEPHRVCKLRVGVPKRIGRYAPLSDAGFTIADVADFWRQQSFQLGLAPHLGNCTGCFLKDQADLSRALDEVGDVDYWASMQERYPGFGGQNHAGYRQLAAEAPTRREIETTLVAGRVPNNDNGMEPRRFRLVVIQERKRLAGQNAAFSCSCEGSDALSQMDDDEENAYIASLPSEDEAP